MTSRTKLGLTFFSLIVLLALAVLVDVPGGPDLRVGSWHKEMKVHLGLDLKGGTRLIYDADVSGLPGGEESSALDGVRDVIERRVNQFGVSEPIVQTSEAGGQHRIIVELAGVQDVDAAIQQIGETPLLEFKELGTPAPLIPEDLAAAEAFNREQRAKAERALADVRAPNADFAAIASERSEDTGSAPSGGDIGFQRRENLVTEYADVLFDQLEDGQLFDQLVESPFGYHVIKRTESRASGEGESAVTEVRSRHILVRTRETHPEETEQTYVETGLTGEHLDNAQVSFDQQTGQPDVVLKFNDEGKQLFGDITTRNLNQPVGIFLDGLPISEPIVQTEITTGEATISGDFDLSEAKELAQRLNAGALPVPITLVNQTTVGPTLGRVSIERSFFAGLVGLAAVVLFMLLQYRFLGFIAVLSLFAYTALTFAIFKLWPVTLTLAGVAGFILSIGIAVDANILIFERIREELRSGRLLGDAVEEGFQRAWLSIRDSNVSSLITTFILAWFGTGIIKGFAITLAIGILVSMFSAVTIARTLLRLTAKRWLQRHPKFLSVEHVSE
ncbi:MAG: protein translocase subunit SecD [Candidatus Kerfeldbacteria bacterium]|nr:protein translocase subunit SecD [Candidatus Kerfeldbacteria bacterium]